MPTNEVIFTRQALAETPFKAMRFLWVIGLRMSIRNTLAEHGYTRQVHDVFVGLLQDAVGLGTFGVEQTSDGDRKAKEAAQQVETWAVRAFLVSHAALRYEYPTVHERLFRGELELTRGFGALVSVGIYLDRLEEIEKDPDSEATRKAGHAALTKLAERGIGKAERDRARSLLNVAHSAIDSDALGAIDKQTAAVALRKLRAMYLEWAEIAKLVIANRQDLVRLGLARRRKTSRRGAERDPVEGPPIDVGKVSAPVVTGSPPVAAPVKALAEAPAGAPPEGPLTNGQGSNGVESTGLGGIPS